MGGLAGHMYHLYENPELTFGEIKDIFAKAANGKLVGTEKTDGQNIFISYSVKTGKAKAARNKTNIKDGGLTAEQLADKFEGRGALKEAFVDAFSAFETAVKRFNIEDQIDIFGPDANIYYNAEIQDPRTANVIQYGIKTLNIHRTGHCEFDRSTGNVIDKELSKQFNKLESVLKDTQDKINQSEYKIVVNAMRNLSALTDKTVLKNSLSQLNNLQKQFNVKDDDTIAQYLINIIDQIIDKQFPDLNINTKKELLKRLMKVKGSTVITVAKTIPKEIQPSLLPAIKQFIENEGQIYKQAILPLESIVHDFAVEMLRALDSTFVLDSKKEVQRLRDELKSAKSAIETSSNEEAMEILKRQFDKIKNIENISTASEGFVFSYNRNTYKFTGNFAPLNQILGLFKYGRGNVPALQKTVKENAISNLSEQQKEKSAVLVWGRFNPPTIGHEKLFIAAKKEAQKISADLIVVPTKTVDDKKNPLTFEEKVGYINTMFPDISKYVLKNPELTTLIEVGNYLKNNGYTHVYPVAGGDRIAEGVFNMLAHPDFGLIVNPVNAGNRDPDSEDVSGMSASKMRQAAVDGDLSAFMKGIAGSLDKDQAKDLLNKIRTRINQKPGARQNKKIFLQPIEENLFQEFIVKSGNKWCLKSKKKTKTGKRKNLGCYSSRSGAEKRERQVQYFKHLKEDELEEMSATSGGAVSGFAGPFKGLKKRQIELEQTNVYSMRPKGGFTYQSRFGSSQKRDDDEMEELFKKEGLEMKDFMIERKAFIEELKLRKIVKEAIKRKHQEKIQSIISEENKLRSIIRQILREGEEDVPHTSTGINVLEDLLTKVIKIIEKDFKQLTTSPEQRKSFRAHIINAVKNSLATERAVEDSPETEEEKLEEQDEQVQDPKFIDVGLDKGKQPEEVDTFTIPGQETTGRNMALKTFDKIEKSVKDSYGMLADKKDKDLFYDYLITNLKLYFDKFETEMNPSISEPESPTYQKEKSQMDAEQATATQPTQTTGDMQDVSAAAGQEQPEAETETGLPPSTMPTA